MKKISFLLSFAFLACFVLPVKSEEIQHVANIKNFSGTVEVLREGFKLPAEAGMQLFASDTIISSSSSSAGVIFTDGTSLAVGPASEINIQNYLFQPHDKLIGNDP